MESLKHAYRVAFLELWTWTKQVYSCIILYIYIYINIIYIYIYVYGHVITRRLWVYIDIWRPHIPGIKQVDTKNKQTKMTSSSMTSAGTFAVWLVLSAAVDDLHSPKITNGSMRCSSRLRGLDAVIPTTRAPGERWKDHFLHDATKLEKSGHLYKHER